MKDFFNKETLDNIKQFCAENKKYVGVAGVLVGLILILIVVVAGGNNGRQSNTEAGSQTEISVKDFEFEKDYTNDAKDDISTLLADYYKAYVGDDLDTLGKLATPMSDNEKSYIGVVSQYYESVNDITPYTKNGLKKGTYFVSVKNSIKFTGVDTQAPTLDFFYIETGKDGKLFINNVYSNFNRTYCENELDDDIMELISKYTASSEFADIHEEVQKAYEQAVGSDANLKTMLETTLTGAIKQWYTSSGIANLKKSDADTQTTEADTQQADDAAQNSDQQTTDANAGQTTDQQTTDANAGQTTDQNAGQTTDPNAGQTTDANTANQQPAEQPQAPAEYQVVTKDVVNPAAIIDTNHSNSGKQFKEQIRIAKEVMHNRQLSSDIKSLVKGLMIESYIEEGSQKIGEHVYGKSITDPCLGWEDSKKLIYDIAEMNS